MTDDAFRHDRLRLRVDGYHRQLATKPMSQVERNRLNIQLAIAARELSAARRKDKSHEAP